MFLAICLPKLKLECKLNWTLGLKGSEWLRKILNGSVWYFWHKLELKLSSETGFSFLSLRISNKCDDCMFLLWSDNCSFVTEDSLNIPSKETHFMIRIEFQCTKDDIFLILSYSNRKAVRTDVDHDERCSSPSG